MNIQVNRQSFNCYPSPITIDKTNIILEQMKKVVCKIKNKNGEGIGFFCYIPFQNKKLPVLITSNHLIDQNTIKENKILSINLNDGKEYRNIELFGNKSIYTNKNYNITIIEIFPAIDKINNFLELDENLFLNNNNTNNNIKQFNETIYILQFSKIENAKKISVSYGLINYANNDERRIFCNSGEDSFGSPILKLSNNKILGIYNQGDSNCNLNKNTNLKSAICEYLNNLNMLKINNNLISANIRNENKLPEINQTMLGPEAGEGEEYIDKNLNETINKGPEIRQTMLGPETQEESQLIVNKNENSLSMQNNQVINNSQNIMNNSNKNNVILINNIQINNNNNIINKNKEISQNNSNQNILNSHKDENEKHYKNKTNNEDFADNLNINTEVNNIKNQFPNNLKNNNNNSAFPRCNSNWNLNKNMNNNNNIKNFNNNNMNNRQNNFLNQSMENININKMINNINNNNQGQNNNINMNINQVMKNNNINNNNINANQINYNINNIVNTPNPDGPRKRSVYNYNLPNLLENKNKYSFSRYTQATKTGLKNFGNSSYLNSVFQLLGSNRDLADFFLNPDNQDYINQKNLRLSYLIERLFIHFYPFPEKNEKEIYQPVYQKDYFDKLNLKNNPNVLLKVILNILHNELNKLNGSNNNVLLNPLIPVISDKTSIIECGIRNFQQSNNSIISNTFNWFEIKESQCSKCNYTTYEFLNLFMLEIDILKCFDHFLKKNKKFITIYDCLEYKIIWQEDNLFCNKCGNFELKLSRSEIFNTPKIFIFSLDRENMEDKNLLNVPFCLEEKVNLVNYKQYELMGIVSIYVQQKKYVCCSKSPVDQNWYYYEDEIIHKVDLKIIINNHNNMQFIPCILVYKEINFNS